VCRWGRAGEKLERECLIALEQTGRDELVAYPLHAGGRQSPLAQLVRIRSCDKAAINGKDGPRNGTAGIADALMPNNEFG